ncbi:PREDICTED: uncharacterized protein LOC108568968 [Nicrophorus vespilloides]|uniref:Uncharacterized protein LOC108568968 n=1 Tax=Nicrophorus vespilloides TaxID=110193 RepID=A0ABM1NG60_NICVS|nr:PREDICTED: uncharacterized protein LOC108568968 [Nicrophorus vespilloides]
MTIVKWLAVENDEQCGIFERCKELKQSSSDICLRIGQLVGELSKSNLMKVRQSTADSEDLINKLNEILSNLDEKPKAYEKCLEDLNLNFPLKLKADMWKQLLGNLVLKICYLLQQMLSDVLHLYIYYGDKILIITFKISNIMNHLLNLDAQFKLSNTMAISSNTCPYLLYPMRKISITKLLQILAQNRAELSAHKLIDCLLETYKLYESHDEESHSDNSSVEIFKALTNHMSPKTEATFEKPKAPVKEGSFLNLDKLIEYEEQNVLELLDVAVTISPNMLGNDSIKKSKLSSKAQEKVLNYYQEILWGEVGNFLEHIILWWGASPLASRPPHSSQHLREWIAQFTPTADVPVFIISTLTSLADGLGVHITSTSWDRNFRLALVASKGCHNAGQLFCEMLQDLISLSNQCEVTNEWIVGAPLEELPLVEQIPVLHRLDHSVHTTRLWAANETKKLANNWDVYDFFMITHCDIVNCLSHLNNVRLVDHTLQIHKGGLQVHVEVCAKMREKLVSEIKANIQKLKDTSKECVDCLASVCTTICLAHLKMIFPKGNYWFKTGNKKPEVQSDYVNKYLDQILMPVLKATEDYLICNMILKLICEALLDHIYLNRIKFSEFGALQLLTDFAGISLWINESQVVSDPIRNRMLKNEVLRKCEGVGRLLLRNPGEKIKMHEKHKKIDHGNNDAQLMPAEMYVPNQEQWLELRANKSSLNFFLNPLCCGETL